MNRVPVTLMGNRNAARVSQVGSGRWSGWSCPAAEPDGMQSEPEETWWWQQKPGSDSPPDSSLSHRVTNHLLCHAYSFISLLSPPPSIFSLLHTDDLHIVILSHLGRCDPEEHTTSSAVRFHPAISTMTQKHITCCCRCLNNRLLSVKPCSAPEERSPSRSAAGRRPCAAAVQMVEAARQMKDWGWIYDVDSDHKVPQGLWREKLFQDSNTELLVTQHISQLCITTLWCHRCIMKADSKWSSGFIMQTPDICT